MKRPGPEKLKEVQERHTALVKEEKRKSMEWLRRNTTLTDEALIQNVIRPTAQTAFDAGREVGFVEGMLKADKIINKMMRGVWYRRGFAAATALAVGVWVWETFLS
jgi:hypothetical protein